MARRDSILTRFLSASVGKFVGKLSADPVRTGIRTGMYSNLPTLADSLPTVADKVVYTGANTGADVSASKTADSCRQGVCWLRRFSLPISSVLPKVSAMIPIWLEVPAFIVAVVLD